MNNFLTYQFSIKYIYFFQPGARSDKKTHSKSSDDKRSHDGRHSEFQDLFSGKIGKYFIFSLFLIQKNREIRRNMHLVCKILSLPFPIENLSIFMLNFVIHTRITDRKEKKITIGMEVVRENKANHTGW